MDELSAYLLERYPRNYITGGEDCNLLIWGAESGDRYIPKMCSLTIGIDYDPYNLPDTDIINTLNGNVQENFTYQKLLNYGTVFAEKTGLPFMVIVYPSMRKEFNNNWEKSVIRYDTDRVQFYCTESINPCTGRTVSGAELRNLIYKKLKYRYTDKGTTKEKNKRIADYFHMWSRDSLSRHIVKFDLDGFIVNAACGKDVLVEFKRSTQCPWIPEWYPKYDKPDYILQYTFAQMIGADFWLLHHEQRVLLEEGYVSFFDINGIDESKSEYFLKFRKRAMKIPLHGERGLDSIIQRFINSPTANIDNSFCCPLCGYPIKHGQYGYYCTGKSAGICNMNVGKHFGDQLQLDKLQSLLAGNQVVYNSDGNSSLISPKVIKYEYNGKTFYSWHSVRHT